MKQCLILFSILLSVCSCIGRNKTNDIRVAGEMSKQVVSTTKNLVDSTLDKHKASEDFIVEFMDKTYFNHISKPEIWAKQYLTDRMAAYLKEMYLSEADSIEGYYCIADWAFEINPATESVRQEKENMIVYHHKGDWFVVQFGKGKRSKKNSFLLKIIKDKDVFKIDNIINEGMGFDGITEK